MKFSDPREFMLSRSDWKRLHQQIQQDKNLTSADLKANIELGQDMILIRLESPDEVVEWKLTFL